MTVYKVVMEYYDFHDCNSSRKYWDEYTSYMVEDTFENVSKFINGLNRDIVANYISVLRGNMERITESRQEAFKKNEIIDNIGQEDAEVLCIVKVSPEFFSRTYGELDVTARKIIDAEKLLDDNSLFASNDFTEFGCRWTIEDVEIISLDKLKEVLQE